MDSIRRAFAVVALLVVTALSAYADHPVTLVLKSGERLAGQFTDLHQDLVYLRSNRNQERRVPVSDIAVIDFTNDRVTVDDDAALRRNQATGHLLVLRNGRRIEGRFEGVTGDDQPHSEGHLLEFVFSTASGEYVRASAERIARIYLAEPRPIDDTTSGGVTVWLEDGTSMQGALTALDARSFALDTMRSDRAGAISRRALDDVAVIDFEGGGGRVAEERGFESRDARAPHLLVMRDGRRLSGEFIGPARQARGGERSYLFRSTSGRIASFEPSTASRLYLGRAEPAMTSQEGDAVFGARSSIIVSAHEGWTPTGLTVRRGDLIAFQARGDVQLSADNNDRARPSGSYSNRLAPAAPLRTAAAGALIGRVGGTVFLIGDRQAGIRMPASGELFLGINDDHFQDNQGSFEVIVQRARSSSN
jgi:small nuclear ribonucleoprotein (snRNP)-like protein